MPPQISVITAVRNGERFLAQAIESIQAQTVADWEYIIVDDASEDDTVALIEDVAAADPRFRLLCRAIPGGPYVAANDGLEVALGRYVARIDADDIAPPTRFEVQLRFLTDRPRLRACGGFHRVLSSQGDLRPSVVRVPVLPGVLRWRLSAGADPVHSSAFLERSALEEIGGYAPLPLAQDWRLWCELSRRGWLGIVPEVVAHRRIHDERVTVREEARQAQFALDVAQEHIFHLTGERWSSADVQLLRNAVHGKSARVLEGLRILDRWADGWRSDPSLTPEERGELRAWTRLLRRRHMIKWAERLPVAGPMVRLGSRSGRAAFRAGADAVRPLRRRGTSGMEAHIQRASRASSGSGSSP